MAFVVGGKSFTSIKEAEAEYARLSAEVAAEKAAIEAKARALDEAQALDAARMATKGIELLSLAGKPVLGVATSEASDAVVFESTDKKTGKVKTTTERDLCAITGYVIVSRDHSGKVRAGWGNPPDFGRYSPVTVQGIEALIKLFSGAA